jgi:phage gp16-like protein
MIIEVKVVRCICDKCKYEWQPKNGKIPDICAKCKTHKWNETEQVAEIAKSFREHWQEKEERKDGQIFRGVNTKEYPELRLETVEENLVDVAVEEGFDFGS